MKDTVTEKVLEVQKTKSKSLKEQIISSIKGEVEKVVNIFYLKKFGRIATDDEKQIGLTALTEAINKFDLRRNASFKTFAESVIINKLIDHFREHVADEKILDHTKITKVSDRQIGSDYLNKERDKEIAQQRKDELVEFAKIMKNVGYTLDDIKKSKPKHIDTRRSLLQLAVHIVNLGLGKRFIKEHQYSSRELTKHIGKKIEKKRLPYLCACIVVIIYDLPIMREYLELPKLEETE